MQRAGAERAGLVAPGWPPESRHRQACLLFPSPFCPSLPAWGLLGSLCSVLLSLILSPSLFFLVLVSHPCPMPGLGGGSCLLRVSTSLCVCERGAGSLCLFPVDVEHPGVRTPSLLTPHPLHYGARVLTSWWGQRRLVREEPAGLEGRAVPGASASPAAIKVQA